MSIIISLVLASASSSLITQLQRELQTCVFETSKLWALKKGTSDQIVDRAEIYCHEKLDRFLIAKDMENKKLGLTKAQSDEINAVLASSLVRINRGFAIQLVEKARSK